MDENRESLFATFRDLANARAAERAVEAAGISSHVTLVENDQEITEGTRSTLESDSYSSTNHRKSTIRNFFTRLFGFDDKWDEKNETHSYFRELYAAKNHLLIVRNCTNAALARKIIEDNEGMIEERGGLLYEQELTRLDSGERVMQLHEEQLLARKERVQTGEVLIRKEIVQDMKTIEVSVTREELVIERRPLHGEAHPGSIDIAAKGESEIIRVPVSEEQVRLEKQVVPTEEIVVAKKRVEDTEVVSDTVRHEEAHVETKGRVDGKRDTFISKDYRKGFRKDRGDEHQPGV